MNFPACVWNIKMAAFMCHRKFLTLLKTRHVLCMEQFVPAIPCTSSQGEQQIRWATNKHWTPKWRRHRWAKYFKVDLPDFEDLHRDRTSDPSEVRARKMKRGIESDPVPRHFVERGIVIACTNDVVEEYVPPEGDGSTSQLQRKVKDTLKIGKSSRGVKKIKRYEENFDTSKFPEEAMDIYTEAHKGLQDLKKNEDRLHELVTEKAWPEMVHKLEKKTLRWNFLKSLEPPRVVQVRVASLMANDNLFGQVTVRFHTQQTLALYDRFGRLLYGSEHLAKNVLEYVVFEKHITETHSTWRLHGKILPGHTQRGFTHTTKRMPSLEVEEEGEEEAPEAATAQR